MKNQVKYLAAAMVAIILSASSASYAQHRGGGGGGGSRGGGGFGGGGSSRGSSGAGSNGGGFRSNNSGGFSGGYRGNSGSSVRSDRSFGGSNHGTFQGGHSQQPQYSQRGYASPRSGGSPIVGRSYQSAPRSYNSAPRGYSSPGYAYRGGQRYSGAIRGGAYYNRSYRGNSIFRGGYHYYGGYYNRYYAPRLGLRINVLPFGYYPFYWGADQFYYNNGLFYQQYDNSSQYQVVEPPMGAVVPNLPQNAKSITIDGAEYYELNGVYYQPVTSDDGLNGYKIVGRDGQLNTEAGDDVYQEDNNQPSN